MRHNIELRGASIRMDLRRARGTSRVWGGSLLLNPRAMVKIKPESRIRSWVATLT